jgi:hypothetical protein
VSPEVTPASGALASSKRWDWRPKVRWFAAEIVVVVAGVLIALALNAWWQGRQDASSETIYLTLIARDLGQMVENLQNLSEVEAQQLQSGFAAYRILSGPTPSDEEKTIVSESLGRLTGRRTIHVTGATYEDLLSTGNLQLIRNRDLRNRLVAFYEEAERQFEIHNKNNTVFTDELFGEELFRRGLIYNEGRSAFSTRTRADSILQAGIAGGYAERPDPMWSLPSEAPEWNVVRSVLLQRIRTANYSSDFARTQLEETRDLQRAVEAELNR